MTFFPLQPYQDLHPEEYFSDGETVSDEEAYATLRLQNEQREEYDVFRVNQERHKWHVANNSYQRFISTAQKEPYKIRTASNRDDAISLLKLWDDEKACMICFTDRPYWDKERKELMWSKTFLVGSIFKFYTLMTVIQGSVYLDEIVLVHRPTRLYFDVELDCLSVGEDEVVERDSELWKALYLCADGLKLMRVESEQGYDREWYDSGDQGDEEDDGRYFNSEGRLLMKRLARKYYDCIEQPFSREVCTAGCHVIVDHVKNWVCRADIQEGQLDIRVCSGCREGKFSLHLVAPELICDCQTLTTELISFEIARCFRSVNLHWLMKHEDDWETPEGIFRIRALKAHEMYLWSADHKEAIFHSRGDTPFDEAVYSPNHGMRAPGACKRGLGLPMVPVNLDDVSSCIMSSRVDFESIYGEFTNWRDYLITGKSDTIDTTLLCGIRPMIRTFPSIQQWYAKRGKYMQNDRRQYITHQRVLDLGKDFENDKWRYEEVRPTHLNRMVGCVVGATGSKIPGNIPKIVNEWNDRDSFTYMEDKLPADPDDVVCHEDGTLHKLVYLPDGSFFFHGCQGADDFVPSARKWENGFGYTCYLCNKHFAFPCSPWKETMFPFSRHEVERNDDPNAHIRDIDWLKFLQDKNQR